MSALRCVAVEQEDFIIRLLNWPEFICSRTERMHEYGNILDGEFVQMFYDIFYREQFVTFRRCLLMGWMGGFKTDIETVDLR